MSLFGDGLEAAVQKACTRPAPKSAGAQMRYLVKQLKGTKAVAQMLRVSQRTVERYVKDQIKKPRPELAARPPVRLLSRLEVAAGGIDAAVVVIAGSADAASGTANSPVLYVPCT